MYVWKEKRKKQRNCCKSCIRFRHPQCIGVCYVIANGSKNSCAKPKKKEYNLNLERIHNISWYNEVDFEKHIKSSLIGGVIGAAAFGAAGAIIGSRPKEKEKKKSSVLFVDRIS